MQYAIAAAVVFGVAAGLFAGYGIGRAVARSLEKKSSSPLSVRSTSRGMWALAILPSLFAAFMGGGDIGATLVYGVISNGAGTSVGLFMGIATCLTVGTATGAILGAALGDRPRYLLETPVDRTDA